MEQSQVQNKKETTNQTFGEENEEKKRIDMLKNRFKHVKKGTETLEPNAFHLFFKTDNKPKNGGRCFYNYNVDTYYVGVRKWKDTIDKIQLEIERDNANTGHTMITFYISG